MIARRKAAKLRCISRDSKAKSTGKQPSLSIRSSSGRFRQGLHHRLRIVPDISRRPRKAQTRKVPARTSKLERSAHENDRTIRCRLARNDFRLETAAQHKIVSRPKKGFRHDMAHLLPLSTGFHPHVPAQDAVTLSMHEFIRLIGPTDARPRVVIDATKLDVPIELLIGEEVRQTTASSNLTLRS